MRKYTLLVFMMLTCIFHASSQMSVSLTGGNLDPGSTIEVDVTVDGFTDSYGFQFSLAYDPAILEYTSITNVTDEIGNDFTINNVGVPDGSTTLNPGQMTTSLNLSQIASVPNGTRLYTIVFTALNEPCDSTSIMGVDFPLESTYIDENFMEPAISFNNSQVNLNGPDCGGGGGGDDLTFSVANQNVQPGVEVCIPITMENFNNFNAGQGKIGWDPTVISFVRVEDQIDGIFNDNTNNVGSGEYNFIWENVMPQNPVSLPDGTALFEMCFDVIGTVGQMTTIDLTSYAPDWGFTDGTGAEPPLELNNGKITITDVVPEPVIITIGDITINEGGNACVSVTVDNFIDILSFQGTFSWNDNIASYTTTTGFGAVDGLGIEDFNNNIQDNNLRVTWNAGSGGTNGVTVADGTEIFQICFDGVGPCGDQGSTLLDFIDVGGFNVEFTQLSGGSAITIEHTVNAGSISIAACPSDCEVVSKTNVLCNGQNTGSIIVDIDPGGASNCQCIWYKDGSTTPFMTLNAPNCNLINVGAGTYNLEVVCDGTTICDNITETITQPGAININGAITNIGCGQEKGSIVLSVSGGASGFLYKWDDDNMSTTKDISNLEEGTYTVTVTDANNCTATKEFSITSMVDDLTASVMTVNHVSCFGENDGSIILSIAGGCSSNGAYNITPSSLTNLAPGVYNITVTDFSNPPQTIPLTATVNGPTAALSIINESVTNSTGPGANDGTINITPTGGTPNYDITWTGGIPNGTTNATGLGPNTYTVTVTDANGCTFSKTYTVNEEDPGTDVTLNSITTTPASCNGEEDGAINGSVSNGEGPYTIDLLSGSSVEATTSLSTAGTFMLNAIGAGTYTLRVTDNNGKTNTKSVTIMEPTAISFDVDIDCANGSSDDGRIGLSVAGGAGGYMVEWSNGETTMDLENIGVGTYSVLIEDANGCQSIINNIRVNDCNPTNCYEAIKIITPNGDGINDLFVINCVMQEQTSLTLYDRWGGEVYHQDNYDNTWSGIDSDGEALPEGGYMWVLVVDFSNSRREVFKGTVTLLTEN